MAAACILAGGDRAKAHAEFMRRGKDIDYRSLFARGKFTKPLITTLLCDQTL